jgi:hypothetical protein
MSSTIGFGACLPKQANFSLAHKESQVALLSFSRWLYTLVRSAAEVTWVDPYSNKSGRIGSRVDCKNPFQVKACTESLLLTAACTDPQ